MHGALRTPFKAGASLAAVVLLALGAGPASAAGATKVAAGDYQMAPIIPANQSYQVGAFRVSKAAGKRQIVRSDRYAGIFYPDAGECDHFDLPLAAKSIPISLTGRFRISERTPVEDTIVQVYWKGHWSKPGIVAGTITISHGSCTSTHKWSGGKVT